jgi:nucleosome assembly protein 1-like 1
MADEGVDQSVEEVQLGNDQIESNENVEEDGDAEGGDATNSNEDVEEGEAHSNDEQEEEADTPAIAALREFQTQRHALQELYDAERIALEQKYNAQYATLYEKRMDIVTGRTAVAPLQDDDVRGIPMFWVTIFQNHGLLTQLVTEKDSDALEYLQDVRCKNDEDMKGYKLEFQFAPNPYFSNTVLTKHYRIPNMLSVGEPMLEKNQGCEIDWKPGQNLCVELVQKKQKKKGRKGHAKVRTVTVEEKKDSFFNFFASPTLEQLDSEDEEDEETRMEMMQEKMEALEVDFETGMVLREQIIPNAVLWFTGEAMSDDEDSDSDYEPEGEESEEESSGDEEEGEAPAFPSMNTLGAGPPAAGENPGECKQQ